MYAQFLMFIDNNKHKLVVKYQEHFHHCVNQCILLSPFAYSLDRPDKRRNCRSKDLM